MTLENLIQFKWLHLLENKFVDYLNNRLPQSCFLCIYKVHNVFGSELISLG